MSCTLLTANFPLQAAALILFLVGVFKEATHLPLSNLNAPCCHYTIAARRTGFEPVLIVHCSNRLSYPGVSGKESRTPDPWIIGWQLFQPQQHTASYFLLHCGAIQKLPPGLQAKEDTSLAVEQAFIDVRISRCADVRIEVIKSIQLLNQSSIRTFAHSLIN